MNAQRQKSVFLNSCQEISSFFNIHKGICFSYHQKLTSEKKKFTKKPLQTYFFFSQHWSQVFQWRYFSKKTCILHRGKKEGVKFSSRAMPASTSPCHTSGFWDKFRKSNLLQLCDPSSPTALAACDASPPKPSCPYGEISLHLLGKYEVWFKENKNKNTSLKLQEKKIMYSIQFSMLITKLQADAKLGDYI